MIPTKVQKVVDESHIDQTLHFIEILGTIRGKPCLRLYAYKHTKTRGKEVKEVGRRFVDRDMVCGSLYYTRLGGYQVVFKGKKRVGYYGVIEQDDHFYEITDSSFHYPRRYYNRLYTAKEAQEHFKGANEWLNYLYIDNLNDIDDTMLYIRAYVEHPSLERLAKMGFGYLWDSKNVYRQSYDSSRKLMSFLKNNREYVLKEKPNLGWIMEAIKANMDAEGYKKYLAKNELTTRLENYKFKSELIDEMFKYILKQASDVYTYYDYLDACDKLKMNINDRGVQFPRNLIESHDAVVNAIDEKKNKETNEGLKKAMNILKPFIENTGEFQLIIPTSKRQLIMWGDALHCCVGKLGYGEKMAKGNTIILGVFLNGKIVECCEIGIPDYGSKEMRILQLRGDHNQPSPYHIQAQQITNQFFNNYKSQRLMGSCI